MRRFLFVLAACLPLAADKPEADTRTILGTDQVTAFWCECFKNHWTQVADSEKSCPFCENHPGCGELDGDYKVVVKAAGEPKAGSEVSLDVELYQIVIDKDSKPDEVKVSDLTKVVGKVFPGVEKDGEFERGEGGPLLEGKANGKMKCFVLKNTFAKKGEYVLVLEIVRGNKGKTKVESEVRLTVE